MKENEKKEHLNKIEKERENNVDKTIAMYVNSEYGTSFLPQKLNDSIENTVNELVLKNNHITKKLPVLELYEEIGLEADMKELSKEFRQLSNSEFDCAIKYLLYQIEQKASDFLCQQTKDGFEANSYTRERIAASFIVPKDKTDFEFSNNKRSIMISSISGYDKIGGCSPLEESINKFIINTAIETCREQIDYPEVIQMDYPSVTNKSKSPRFSEILKTVLEKSSNLSNDVFVKNFKDFIIACKEKLPEITTKEDFKLVVSRVIVKTDHISDPQKAMLFDALYNKPSFYIGFSKLPVENIYPKI